MRIKWSDKLLKTSQNILRKHDANEFDDALIAISEAAGQEVSSNALRAAFASGGLGSPLSFLQKPKYIPDPVEKQEQKEEESQDKRHIKQLVEQLRVARERQKFLDVVTSFKAPPKIMPRETKSGVREMTAVVLMSDLHVEEPVDPEAVAYRNEYNLEIADKRLKRLFNGVIWNIEHQRASNKITIRDLVLWLGGDFMSGFIHEDLIQSNELSPTETIVWLLPRIRDGIYTLLKILKLDHIEIPCSFGNHGRTTPKTRVQNGYSNSYEWLFYNMLASEFRNESRVHFEITASAHQYVQVYDFMLHFHHGDSVRYAGGIGGLGVPLLKAIPQWDSIKYADYHHVGHFHTLSDFGRVLVNGSLIGYGPYSQWIRASYEPPQQMMYLLDKTRGKCQVTPIWCADNDESAHPKPQHIIPKMGSVPYV